MAVVAFGLFVAALGSADSSRLWNVVVVVVGFGIVAAAVGLVELVMAAYYRARRQH